MRRPALPEIQSEFPPLRSRSLFIEASGDVRGLRVEIEQALRIVVQEQRPGDTVEPYSWDIDREQRPFDQRLSWQKNLSRPADELCVAAVCVVGERLGIPLEADFDVKKYIPSIDSWVRGGLRHPWPEDPADQDRALKDGSVPLTGTVFEYIDAIEARKRVMFGYLASKRIQRTNCDALLNDGAVDRAAFSRHLANKAEYERWFRKEYQPQVQAVRNFVALVQERVNPPNTWFRTGPDFVDAVTRFLRDVFAPEWRHDNPYRSLAFYDIADAADYVGHEDERTEFSRQLVTRLDLGQPAVLLITGESGCGKSSFMRAGLLARLLDAEFRGRHRVAAFGPEDFEKLSDHHNAVLERLLTLLEERPLGSQFTPAPLDFLSREIREALAAGHQAGARVAETVVAALDKVSSDGRLFLGFDQFEEVLSDLASPSGKRRWRPLLEFVRVAAASGRVAVVLTLESDWREAVAGHFPSTPCVELSLGGTSDLLLRKVIERPFRDARMPLSQEVVNEIRNEARREGAATHLSPLPLTALTLSRLFDRLRQAGWPRDGGPTSAEANARGPVEVRLSDQVGSARVQDLLPIAAALEESIDSALEETNVGELWKACQDQVNAPEVRAQYRSLAIDGLDHFLHPLVRLTGPDSREVHLQASGVPPYRDERRLFERFSAQGLLRRVNQDQWQLVHKAVIEAWPLAREWRESRSEILLHAARLRLEAHAWRARREEGTPEADEAIDAAAAVLTTYLRTWSMATASRIDPEDELLKQYCLAILDRCTTPRRTSALAPRARVHLAAAYGRIGLLQRFAESDPECLRLESADIGRQPVHVAAFAQPDALTFLLSRGVDPLVPDRHGWRPLAMAINTRNQATARILLDYYKKPEDFSCPDGGTMLHLCGDSGADTLARLLVEYRGLDAAARDDEGMLPLHRTARAERDYVRTFQYFSGLCDIKSTDRSGRTALHLAASSGHTNVVEELVQDHFFASELDRRDSLGRTALMGAAQGRQSQAVARLLDFCDPLIADTAGRTALHHALSDDAPQGRLSREAMDRTYAIVKLLLAAGADPTRRAMDGKTPLALARSMPAVLQLMAQDERIDPGAGLVAATSAGDHGLVTRFLSLGSSLDTVGHGGAFPPSQLLELGRADLVMTLLRENRIDPWAVGQQAPNLLSRAVFRRETELVDELIGSVPVVPDGTMTRMLTEALAVAIVQPGGVGLVGRLLRHGADPNAPVDAMGMTPLLIASRHGRLDLIDVLRADPRTHFDVFDEWGRSALDHAPDTLRDQVAIRIGHPVKAPDIDPDLRAAALLGDLEEFRELLGSPQVDATGIDKWGRTALDFAPDELRSQFEDLVGRPGPQGDGGADGLLQ